MTGSFRVQLVNMGTRGAAFQAKLRSLHEYHRLLSNQMPAPSGSDIANTIKYFSQTLLTVLKDVPCSPLEIIKDPSLDQVRMASYPNLEYQNLYNALTMLLDVASNIQNGLSLFGKALLQCLGCILPFLDKDLIDNLPYLTASSISVLPASLHQDIINYLCYYILPFTITRQSDEDQECHACQSISAVIMLVFQYSNNPAHHCQLLESLMRLKHNVVKDLLCVIAYGTSGSRASAAKLLFYYWPAFDPNLFDRKGLLCKFTNNLVPFVCQRESCPNAGNAEAVKVCYDHCISILYAVDSPPPLYLCIECANEIHRDHPDLLFGDILHPMQQVSMICENKNCRSTDKSAISICFSNECASYNGNHPIRYCTQCHNNRHNSRRGVDHVFHRSLPNNAQMDAEMQAYLVEAVISLLREAKPLNLDFGKDFCNDAKNNSTNGAQDMLTLDDRQLLGRYGIWLLVGRCKPTADTPPEILGRLLSMLFHWFHVTAYSYDGQVESTLEKLKQDHVCGWLKDVCDSHYKEFIDCLLPHPPEFSRVGGHWDTLASRTSHLKEGLQRLICLIPYEIITQKIYDTVMPHYMEAVTNDVPEKELMELKIVLSKILDPEMSPLGFDAKAMYNFVIIRFEKTTAKVQEQALHWLQNLTKLEILIPLVQLFNMFGDGVRIMKHGMQAELNKDKESRSSGTKQAKEKELPLPRRSSISPVVEDDSANTSAISDDEAPISRHTEFSSDAEHNLTCCILMLDILLKQMELQEIEQHTGIYTNVSESICRLLKCMVTAAKVGLGNHICSSKECGYCEASVMWHQLSTKLVQYLAPLNPVRPPDAPLPEIIDDEKIARKSPPESDKENKIRDRDVSLSMAPLPIPLGPLGPVPVAVPQPEPHSVGGVLVHMPHVCSIMTATVETVSEQLDLAAIMPSEKIVTAVARSVTLSEADVATATVQIAKPTVIDTCEGDEEFYDTHYDLADGENFWHTSVGKFKFSIDNLPQSLQYIHQLLKELPTIDKPDILYYTLQCLKIMVLHGDAFVKAARDDRGFFIWCQENLLIKNLWNLCNAEHSHICEVSIPILLHCITLPLGSDVFWNVVQDAFHHNDWRIRFQATERVTACEVSQENHKKYVRQNMKPKKVHDLHEVVLSPYVQRSTSPDQKTMEVQKRAVEPYIASASSSAYTIQDLPQCAENRGARSIKQGHLKHLDRPCNYVSPETPLSKMDLMNPPPLEETTSTLMTPTNLVQLEIPTPERLLPIGKYGKENVSALGDRVREALTIPDINQLKQDSFDKSDSAGSIKDDVTTSSRGTSPRKLIKQVALESPPQLEEVYGMVMRNFSAAASKRDETVRQPKQRLRKVGPFAIGSISSSDGRIRYAGAWAPSSKDDTDGEDAYTESHVNSDKPSASRVGDECICERCSECGAIKEEYTDEEMGIMLIILGTFIHREPALAAPFLPEILTIISRVALHSTFPWQCESATHLPGGSQSVAHQFIRCVLHQLAPNGIFYQIFLIQGNETSRKKLYKSVSLSLGDFTELNPTSPVQLLIETLNSKKTLPPDLLPIILRNMSEYLQCVQIDNISPSIWSTAVQGIDTLFRRILFMISSLDEADNLLQIMTSILKVPQLSKNVLEPFSKILSYAIQNFTLTHKALIDICYLNNKAFSKERDKMQLCRQIVFELVQALKFKTNIVDSNLLLLVGILLQDAGGILPPGLIDDLPDVPPPPCNIAECMKTYLNDVIEFLADFHTLSKIKFLFTSRNNVKNCGITPGLSEDTLGGVLKATIAQYLALEMSRGNSRDNRAVSRYLPWLNNAPSSLQQGPKEFTDCVGHMRLLAWLLMGSLTHTALLVGRRGGHIGQHGAAVHYHQHPSVSQPVPQESSCHIADHIQVIFAGFAEQSKTSVLHMSSLFHAFTLCQLWTVYLEQIAYASTPSSEAYNITMGILFEFWSKVTPCILQLVSHSKLSESVNLHFLSLLEALKETRSTILAKLLPLWTPVLSSNTQLSGTLHVRLQNCRDAVPSEASEALLKWLQHLQFKMGQIELQSSTATQFYSL
ncbi:protein unc-79 homolog isoform X9 [Culex quinquefasciatus]|uniref:protein unc-79 homolog isoform X9 n=1 Tax=Culex quinquefasciatus TaxID=7176 RepID=UPI0018E3F6BD|nr:protein unc-79 homolog isoform X9 [Culex quinquefasciatus]